MNIPHLLLLPVALLCAAGAVLWVSALVSVLRSTTALRALVWLALTLVLPVLGPVVWFVVGRGYERDLAAERTSAHTGVLAH